MEARAALADLNRRRAELGGDERSRAREIELCRYQMAELDEAGLEDPGEEEALKAEEAVLADASASRDAARKAAMTLGADGAVGAGLAQITASLESRSAVGEPSRAAGQPGRRGGPTCRLSYAGRRNPSMRIQSAWPRSASAGS